MLSRRCIWGVPDESMLVMALVASFACHSVAFLHTATPGTFTQKNTGALQLLQFDRRPQLRAGSEIFGRLPRHRLRQSPRMQQDSRKTSTETELVSNAVMDTNTAEGLTSATPYPGCAEGTVVVEQDGKQVLQRKDGTQVVRVQCSGFYCVDVESIRQPGTESNMNTLVTTVKVIVGGVAPLLMPWCIKNQGLLGGPLTVLAVGMLSSFTVKQLVEYKDAVCVELQKDDLTYVDVANHAFGSIGGNMVFAMTLLNSLGICAAYSAFIGSTLASLSATEGNFVHDLLPGISSSQFQLASASVVLPLNSLSSNPRFLSFAAYLGAAGVAAGVLATTVYGFSVTPDLQANIQALPLFTSPSEYFTSFGVIPLLFCVHFAVLPIERSMKNRQDFGPVLDMATIACVLANAAFGVMGFIFFGSETSSVVLDNLGSGPVLTAVKLSLVVDMIVSYPVMLASSREIVENLVLGPTDPDSEQQFDLQDAATRNVIRAGLLLTAFGIAQLNDVGKICNLVGGVAQSALAFLVPPALAIKGAEVWGLPTFAAGAETVPGNENGSAKDAATPEQAMKLRMQSAIGYAIGGFGMLAASATIVQELTS